MAERLSIRVTTYRGAEIIAKAIRKHNPVAAAEYMEKFELRQSLERDARNSLEEAYKNSLV